MRLIDADELEKVMTEDWFLENLAVQDTKSAIKKDIVNMIDSVPLAYDVDAVVKEIREYAECDDECAKEYNLGYGCTFCKFNTVINFIRKGGV